MSRILARALGGGAGPDPVRPRLPTRFEPGLEMASAPELVAGQPEAGGREDLEPSGPAAGDRAGEVIGPAGRWSEPREPADPRAGSPLAGPGSAGRAAGARASATGRAGTRATRWARGRERRARWLGRERQARWRGRQRRAGRRGRERRAGSAA